MKKALILLLALCLCLTALGAAAEAPAVTIEDLVAANLREAALTRHESILNTIFFNGEVWSQQYNTRDLILHSAGAMLDAEGEWSLNEGKLLYDWFIMSDAEQAALRELPEDYEPIIYPEDTLQETVISVEDNGDGTLTIVTALDPETAAAIWEAQGSDPATGDWEGAGEEIVYVVQADTLEIITQTPMLKKGEDTFIRWVSSFSYDEPVPEELAAFKARVDAYKSAPLTNPRTVTVIYDYGTPEEETYSITAGEDCLVGLVIRDGYGMFSDPEGTAPYVSKAEGDKTIYLFPVATEE